MERDKPINISLTGENSHRVKIPAGQGSFSIGAVGMDKKKFDVLVEKEAPINWDAFNECYTPHGKQNAQEFPYGDWPRFFYYWGNDTGFIEWSKKRSIESFSWHPDKPFAIDLSDAQIRSFSITASENPIKLMLGNQDDGSRFSLQSLSLSGHMDNFEVLSANNNLYLRLYPDVKKGKTEIPYSLPLFKDLNAITILDIGIGPMGQAFDCKSLLQFPGLKELNLSGNITNVDCLKNLKNLERLAIRYAPCLENFPTLNSWQNLKSFIGWNIDEKAGKQLSTELKQLAKEKELDYSSVSKLRNSIWFTTEYGIPFANWADQSAKIATKAYKVALKEISKAKTVEEVKIAIIKVVEVVNKLPNIETMEREDTGVAINQLIETSSLVTEELGNKWFDEARDF